MEITPSDVKALFRRCQAYDKLEQFSEAFKDARAVNHLDPNNSAVKPYLTKLNVKVQEMVCSCISSLFISETLLYIPYVYIFSLYIFETNLAIFK